MIAQSRLSQQSNVRKARNMPLLRAVLPAN